MVDADARVASFRGYFPEAKYVASSYSGDEASAMRDVVRQDCGDVGLPVSFTRASYVAKAASVVAYVNGTSGLFCVASKLNTDAFPVVKGDPALVANTTLLTVNDEPITVQQLQAAIAQLTPEAQNQTTLGAILNQLVDQTLLRQAAKDLPISDADLAVAAEESWRAAGFADKPSFESALAQRGATYDSFLSLVRDQLKVRRLLERDGITAVNVSPDLAQRYYLDNPNLFLVGEQVQFRQLFIGFNASGSRERAQGRLEEATQRLRAGDSFCDAIRRYSDDESSKERCGEYLAPRGVLLPALEGALFSLGVNESAIVESPNGLHLVVVLAHQPTSVIPYAQAQERLLGLLKDAAVQQRLSIYLLRLRADARIVDYT